MGGHTNGVRVTAWWGQIWNGFTSIPDRITISAIFQVIYTTLYLRLYKVIKVVHVVLKAVPLRFSTIVCVWTIGPWLQPPCWLLTFFFMVFFIGWCYYYLMTALGWQI